MDNIDSLVWDATVGAGCMPETVEPVLARVEQRLKRELTRAEKQEAERAYAQCYQEFHQP